jgi:hypothetical protein
MLICLFSTFHRMLICARIGKMAESIRMDYMRRHAAADLQRGNGDQ